MIRFEDHQERERILTDLVPDLTPLIDVMFMLIVFLVLTTNSLPHVFDVALPEDQEGVTQIEEDLQSIVVSLHADGGYSIDHTRYDALHAFKTALQKRLTKQRSVVVYGDKQVTLDQLLGVLTFFRAQGVEVADIVMQ